MVVVGEETRAFACITAPKKTISEPLQTQDIPGTVSLAFVPWKARESALLRGSPLCESVQTRSLQLPLVSLFFPPPNSRTLGTRYSCSTHTRSSTLAPKIPGLELLLGGGRSEERQRLGRAVAAPRDAPPPNGGRPPRSAAARWAARPPARRPPRAPTAAQPGRWAVVISGNGAGSAVDERGGGAGGAPGRRAGGAGRHVRQWPGGAGRALLPALPPARPPAPPPATEPGDARGVLLNTRADKSFIFQTLTSLTPCPSAERSLGDLGRGTPSWEGGR